MAPIDVLPAELFQQIFLFFCPTSLDTRERRIVTLLSSVCRRWRVIINSTPEFWTLVNIGTHLQDTFEDAELDRVRTHLSRSKSLPIDVIWQRKGTCPSSLLFETIRALSPFNRWRSLTIASAIYIREGQLARCGIFENLEELTLRWQPPVALMNLIDRTAIRLTKLTLTRVMTFNVDYPYPLQHVRSLAIKDPGSFPYNNLPRNITHLDLRTPGLVPHPSPYVTHLTTDLIMLNLYDTSLFPNLQYLKAQIEGSTTSLLLPKLRHLVVLDSKVGIAALVLPQLETLQIKGEYRYQGFAATSLNDAVCDPRYSLTPTTLHLDISLPSNTILDVLAASKSVHYLRIQFRDPSTTWDIVWRALVVRPEPEHIYIDETVQWSNVWRYCPDLIALEVSLGWVRKEKEIWIVFAAEIARYRAGGPMQSIALHWSCGSRMVTNVNHISGLLPPLAAALG